MADWIGRSLSKVTIQKLAGRGGMADVYLGLHTTLNRPVAVKILHGHLLEDDELIQRFRSEAQSVANLRHPNIVQVYDFDLVDDQPYIVMEMLEGTSLADYLGRLRKAEQVIPPRTISRIVSTLAGALDYAHSRGIVHRDVKPSNVILRTEGGPIDPTVPLPDKVEPVLTDFGIARISNTTIRTASGAIVGTPAYMSPEQISGQIVDSRSDVYSLGIMIYEMIAMRLPFEAESETIAAMLVKHITEPPPPLVEAPDKVRPVVMQALAKDRTARYQTAGDLAFDLKVAYGLPISDAERKAREHSTTMRLPHTAGGGTGITKLGKTVRGHPVLSKSSSWRGLLLVTTLVALLVLIAALAVVELTGGDNNASTQGTDSAQGNTGDLAAGNNDPANETVFGVVRFADAAVRNDQVVVDVANLSPLPDDMQYEIWLLGIEDRVPMGKLELDDTGHAELVYVKEDGADLLSDYGRFEITVEPKPDPNPLPTGEVAYSGAVPPGSLTHVRHLLSAFSRTPDGRALVIGLVQDADLLLMLVDELEGAYEEDDLEAVKRHAEGIVNLIEGSGGEHHGDLDGDDDPYEPGDGFGLLPGMQGSGYIQSAIEHARYAAGTEDATAYVIAEAQKLETAAQNLGGWAAQISEAALAIIDSEAVTDEDVQQIVDLVDLFINGQDMNDNGEIEAIPNEGGVAIVHDYALRMGYMLVLEGRDRTPAPATVNPNPNILPEPGSESASEPGSDQKDG